MAGAQHRLLDGHGRGYTHRHYHERCILKNAPLKNKNRLNKAKSHCPQHPHGYWTVALFYATRYQTNRPLPEAYC